MTEPDVLGALGERRHHELGGRGVRVLLQEVVLDLEDVVEPELVGQLHLFEHLVVDPALVVRIPAVGAEGFGELQLVEEAELHRAPFSANRARRDEWFHDGRARAFEDRPEAPLDLGLDGLGVRQDVEAALGDRVGDQVGDAGGIHAIGQEALLGRLPAGPPSGAVGVVEVVAQVGRPVALGGHDVGRDHAGAQQGHADGRVDGAEVVPQALGEPGHRVLGDRVDRSAAGRQAEDRRGVDDVALLAVGEHPRHERADPVDDAHQVDAEDPGPVVLGGGPQGRRPAGHPCVVAQHVDRAEAGLGAGGQRVDRGRVGDVGRDGQNLGAPRHQLVLGRGQRPGLDVGQDDARSPRWRTDAPGPARSHSPPRSPRPFAPTIASGPLRSFNRPCPDSTDSALGSAWPGTEGGRHRPGRRAGRFQGGLRWASPPRAAAQPSRSPGRWPVGERY